jgi:ferritin heavy chain
LFNYRKSSSSKSRINVVITFAISPLSDNAGDLTAREHFDNIEFVDMKRKCILDTEDQIKKEITASLKYLSLAAYFSQDDVNRPGYAKFFFDAASEEREHAKKLIEYLQMRGRYFDLEDSAISNINIGELVKGSQKAALLGLDDGFLSTPKMDVKGSSAGMQALRTALKMEKAVTDSIRGVMITCESETVAKNDVYNDYHVRLIELLRNFTKFLRNNLFTVC